MARIIIQGNKEECNKALNSLKNIFTKFEKRANVITEDETMIVADVYQERSGRDGFTDEEINFALLCHSSKDQRCPECPYRKESNCTEKLIADGALMVSRLFQLKS